MRKYRLIGLTGQSGAGKSTVSRLFAERGATVIDADALVREIYSASSPCVAVIASVFGGDCLLENGAVNRKLLAERAFSSPERTALLGSIVHPFVTAELLKRLRGTEGIVIYDAPQLFESGADAVCDLVIAVTAAEETRVERIIRRDGVTDGQARLRVGAQLSEEFFRVNADIIIENNDDADTLRRNAHAAFISLGRGEMDGTASR